jgi:hypothetical protein
VGVRVLVVGVLGVLGVAVLVLVVLHDRGALVVPLPVRVGVGALGVGVLVVGVLGLRGAHGEVLRDAGPPGNAHAG